MVNISNLTINRPFFTKGTTVEQVSINAKFTNLTQGKSYNVKWFYQFSGQTDWIELNSNNINIRNSSNQRVFKVVHFTPNIPTDIGSVLFKVIVIRLDDTNDSTEVISGAIPINNVDNRNPSESLKTPIITNLISTNSCNLKLDRLYRPELIADVSNLTPGVNYSCDWSYMLDALNTAEKDLGTSIITSSNDKATKIANSEIKIPSYVNSDVSSRKIYFILRISATDPNILSNSVSTLAFISGFYCVKK